MSVPMLAAVGAAVQRVLLEARAQGVDLPEGFEDRVSRAVYRRLRRGDG